MSSRFDVSPAAREAQLLGFLGFFSAGADHPAIEIYPPPTVPAGNPAGTPLVRVLLQKPAALLQNGVLVLQPLTPEGELALSTGDASWARLVNGAGTWVADADVSLEGGDAVFQLAELRLRAGGRVPLLTSIID